MASERGKRSVFCGMASYTGKQLLEGFVFTPKRPNILPCNYNFDWNTLAFSVTGYNRDLVGFPLEASYMELVLGVVRFNFETNRYESVFELPMVIERGFSGDTFSIAASGLPSGKGILFAAVRVAFYQEVNGAGYLLPGGGAFGLEIVGVEGV